MKIDVVPVLQADHIIRRIVIELDDADLMLISRDDLCIGFWQQMDKAAEKFGIESFCPCHERPHRISCPLGFNKYFQAAPSTEGKEKEA